jgi:hypothetical protein
MIQFLLLLLTPYYSNNIQANAKSRMKVLKAEKLLHRVIAHMRNEIIIIFN